MENLYINNILVEQIYEYLIIRYENNQFADYIFSSLSIDIHNKISLEISYNDFFNLLYYLNHISEDNQICYETGVYFAKTKLYANIKSPFIKNSSEKTFKKMDVLLKNFFSEINVTNNYIKDEHLDLKIFFSNKAITPNYYFYEFIKGIISAIPERWNLPRTKIKVKSYPIDLNKLLNDIDIVFKNENNKIFIGEKIVAEEKDKKIQKVTSDLYIRDIYIPRKVKMNTDSFKISIKWKSFTKKQFLFKLFLDFMGIAIFIFLFYQREIWGTLNIVSWIVVYYFSINILMNLYKKSNIRKIYRIAELEYIADLKKISTSAGEAVFHSNNRLKSIENLIEITKKIIYEKDIVSLFATIRKLAAEALHAERATVFIHDSSNHELISGPGFSEKEEEFRIPEDRGIAGDIFKLKKVINIKDAYNNPNFNKSIDRQTGFKTKTILGAPLIDLGNNLVGVIQVLNKKEGEFTDFDEELLKTLSAYIASALKDSLTLQNLKQQGIDPELFKGLNSVTQFLMTEINVLQNKVSELSDPESGNVFSRFKNSSVLLKQLTFIFNDDYMIKDSIFKIRELLDSFVAFINQHKKEKNIVYDHVVNISINSELQSDRSIINRAFFSILINSIESIETEGEIKVRIYNYIILPKKIVYEYNLKYILDNYNTFCEENTLDFIEYLKGKKPLLENELTQIIAVMEKYIVFDIADTGEAINRDEHGKIFQPFYSTKDRFGLGLPQAKTAITRLGGEIILPKKFEKEKIFRILLPYAMKKDDHYEK